MNSIWKADGRLVGQVANVLRIVNFCHSSLSLFTCHTKGFPGVCLFIRFAVAITNSSFYFTIRCQHTVVGIVTTLRAEHSRNRGSIPSRGQRFFSSTHLLTYLLTYLLTPWRGVLLEKLTGFQLVKKFLAFYGTRKFITVVTSASHVSLPWASSIQSIPPHPISWRSIFILYSHLRQGLPNGLIPSGFLT